VTRPATFHTFIGQRATVALLKRELKGAQTRGEPFPHALFIGPSGVGKTHLARALAAAYGTGVQEAMGCDSRQTLARKLGCLKAGEFLHVDECHRLGHLEQELLCFAVDQLKVPDLAAEGDKDVAATARAPLPPWTLVLSTDQPGKLLNALHKRVVMQFPLGDYSTEEMKEVVEALAEIEKLLLTPQAARTIAAASMGLPRRAWQLLRQLRFYFPDSETRKLVNLEIMGFLEAFGIDKTGLGPMEGRYLQELGRFHRASLDSMALLLGVDADFVKMRVEPQLVKQHLVTIFPSGRCLTEEGRKRLRDLPTREGTQATTEEGGNDEG
jgi:Holliday junction resolvasome RuvABC ATP-dependent DNA helicase subunit